MPNALSDESIVVLVNSRSGSADDCEIADRIRTAFDAHGVGIEVKLCNAGESIGEIARRAIAEGVSLDLDETVATIVEGHRRRVDVSGRVFVNNSSLGLYSHSVRHRRNQRRLGRGRWSALVQALWMVIGRYPFLYVHVSTDGRDGVTRTPLVFVGNNEYTVQGLQTGKRTSLSQGRLSLYMMRQVGVAGFLRLALRTLIGVLRTAKDFVSEDVHELCIECRRDSVHVALDGEVMKMEPPLRYRCRPQALMLIAAPEEQEK